MMTSPLIFRCGVDLVHIQQFGHMVHLAGEPLLNDIFTSAELEECQGHTDRLSTRVAAKEAVSKALGTGIRKVRWTDIEITTQPSGQPGLRLNNAGLEEANTLGLQHWTLSLSHEADYAIAYVIGCNLHFGADLAELIPKGRVLMNPPPPTPPLAERLKEAREFMGFTQEAVAQHLGIPRSAVSALESGKRNVKSDELQELARLYGRTVSYFVGETEPDTDSPTIAALFRTTQSLSAQDQEQVLKFAQFLKHAKQPLPSETTED